MKTRVGVIFGGRSGEHEISIRSAVSVIEEINKEKYTAVPIAIERSGNWLSPAMSAKLLPESTAALLDPEIPGSKLDSVGLLGDPRFNGLVDLGPGASEGTALRLDVVFPVLHGPFGEDGTIQGVLDMSGIPYVGCGVLASACGMDKVIMKSLFSDAGLPMCRYVWFLRSEWETSAEAVTASLEKNLEYPFFVKPANLGSSVGISRVNSVEELPEAISLAAAWDRKIIVEEALSMREIECAVLGNDQPEASLPGEYLIHAPEAAFLDYEEKYSSTGNNEFIVPSPVSAELSLKIRELAIRAFKAIDASGLARVDFFLRKDNGSLLVNEINTMPGLTDASGYPKMWEGTGLEFTDLIDRLITLAIERNADRKRNR